MGLENLNADLRDQLQLPSDVKGVVVTNVQPGSPADNAGISRGDVILEVNRHQVQSAEDVKRELGNVAAGKDAMVLHLVQRRQLVPRDARGRTRL